MSFVRELPSRKSSRSTLGFRTEDHVLVLFLFMAMTAQPPGSRPLTSRAMKRVRCAAPIYTIKNLHQGNTNYMIFQEDAIYGQAHKAVGELIGSEMRTHSWIFASMYFE
jgi:hypothetical protein